MEKKIKNKWIDKLFSNEYQRCKGRLRKGESYCVMGVLCDVVDPQGWKLYPGVSVPYWMHFGRLSSPSEEVLKAAKLDLNQLLALVMRHDVFENSFKEDAIWIRENL